MGNGVRRDWAAVGRQLREQPLRPVGLGQSSAVLALVAGDRLVFEVRARHLRRQPGEICLPGGRMEPGETPETASLREAREELGLEGVPLTPLGPLGILLLSDQRLVYPILAHCPPLDPGQLRPNLQEVEQVFSVPLSWFSTHSPTPYQYRQQYTGLEGLPDQMAQWLAGYPSLRKGVYWDYQGHLIWGLTARVIPLVLEAAGLACPAPSAPLHVPREEAK